MIVMGVGFHVSPNNFLWVGLISLCMSRKLWCILDELANISEKSFIHHFLITLTLIDYSVTWDVFMYMEIDYPHCPFGSVVLMTIQQSTWMSITIGGEKIQLKKSHLIYDENPVSHGRRVIWSLIAFLCGINWYSSSSIEETLSTNSGPKSLIQWIFAFPKEKKVLCNQESEFRTKSFLVKLMICRETLWCYGLLYS